MRFDAKHPSPKGTARNGAVCGSSASLELCEGAGQLASLLSPEATQSPDYMLHRGQPVPLASPLVPIALMISDSDPILYIMRLLLPLSLLVVTLISPAQWTHYGADAGGSKYSPLRQINRDSVAELEVAWTYHTGALEPASDLNSKAASESTPILVAGSLVLTTPFNHVIALDPATGAERWKYDPAIDRSKSYSEVTNRGVASWNGSGASARVFLGTLDGRLIALDAATGRPVESFGEHGVVDLTTGINVKSRGDYQMTSPPAVVGNTVVVGSSIGDNRRVDVESGVVRGYNAMSGKLIWSWDPIPWAQRQELPTGAANAWSVLSADPERDMVFIPTGSASPDFFGGRRPGENRWANSVVALKASTGEFVWGFQAVHHDIWDFDIAAQPSLFQFKGETPAIAFATKSGYLYVLDRLTGEPLLPVKETAVPKSDVAGEMAHPTQPIPTSDPLLPLTISDKDLWGATEKDLAWCRERFAELRYDGPFTPPSLQGSLQYPGNVGGVNWGGTAVSPDGEVAVANVNLLGFMVRLIPQEALAEERRAAEHNRLTGEFAPQRGTAYAMYRQPFMTPGRMPCLAPPWGTVVATNANTGKRLWSVPLGRIAPGAPEGSPNLGGPILTAGGLVITAAAFDPTIRAFDSSNGKLLWQATLPASAQATPMTYEADGRQYIVISAGGHGKLKTQMGDAVVAYALPLP